MTAASGFAIYTLVIPADNFAYAGLQNSNDYQICAIVTDTLGGAASFANPKVCPGGAGLLNLNFGDPGAGTVGAAVREYRGAPVTFTAVNSPAGTGTSSGTPLRVASDFQGQIVLSSQYRNEFSGALVSFNTVNELISTSPGIAALTPYFQFIANNVNGLFLRALTSGTTSLNLSWVSSAYPVPPAILYLSSETGAPDRFQLLDGRVAGIASPMPTCGGTLLFNCVDSSGTFQIKEGQYFEFDVVAFDKHNNQIGVGSQSISPSVLSVTTTAGNIALSAIPGEGYIYDSISANGPGAIGVDMPGGEATALSLPVFVTPRVWVQVGDKSALGSSANTHNLYTGIARSGNSIVTTHWGFPASENVYYNVMDLSTLAWSPLFLTGVGASYPRIAANGPELMMAYRFQSGGSVNQIYRAGVNGSLHLGRALLDVSGIDRTTSSMAVGMSGRRVVGLDDEDVNGVEQGRIMEHVAGFWVNVGPSVNQDPTRHNQPLVTINPTDPSQTVYVFSQQANLAANEITIWASKQVGSGWSVPIQVPTTPGRMAAMGPNSIVWRNNKMYITWEEADGTLPNSPPNYSLKNVFFGHPHATFTGGSDIKVATWDGVGPVTIVGSTPTVNNNGQHCSYPSLEFNSRGVLYVSYAEGSFGGGPDATMLVLKHLDPAGNWATDVAHNAATDMAYSFMTMIGETQYRIFSVAESSGRHAADYPNTTSGVFVQMLQ